MNTLKAVVKPCLRTLCLTHDVSLLALARASGRSCLIVWDMLLGYPMTGEDAHMVLYGFNSLSGTKYKLEDIRVEIVPR